MFRRSKGAVWSVAAHRRTKHQTKNTPHFIIQFAHTVFPFTQAFQIGRSHVIVVVCIARSPIKTVRPTTEFHIQSVFYRLLGIVYASPVGNDYSVKAPLFLQYLFQQVLIMATMFIFILIVRSHKRPYLTLLHSRLESRQVDFMQSSVIYLYIDMIAVYLLIVESKMFHTSSHTILLHTLYIRYYHTGSQIRVFAHVLKVTSIERCTIDVYARSQQDVFVAVTRFFRKILSVKTGYLWIPCSRQTSQGRKCRTRIIGPSGTHPFVPCYFLTNTMRTIRHPVFRNTQSGNTR